MSGRAWQAALQRAAEALLHYLLRQMQACSQWYTQAAGLATPGKSGKEMILVNEDSERPCNSRVDNIYHCNTPSCAAAPARGQEKGVNAHIPGNDDCQYQQHTRAANEYSNKNRQSGFSLLEIMVAFSIMAMSFGLLYRITGSSALQVSSVQQHEQAMALAASLLDTVPAVPEQGLEVRDAAVGYEWAIATRHWPTESEGQGSAPRLHEVQVTVYWRDGERVREFSLSTLRPERLPEPGAGR